MKCTKCLIDKELTEFYKRSDKPNKYRSHCKSCIYIATYNYLNKTEKGKEVRKKADYNYYHSENGHKKVLDRLKTEPYLKNAKEWRKRYYSVPENRQKKRNARKLKRQNDLQHRLRCNIRSRINDAIKRGAKTSSSKELLGCSIEFYKEYLQNKFLPGMAWENYGKWEIDHIIPLASFDLTILNNQKIAFNYLNTQPLWASDNKRKSDRLR